MDEMTITLKLRCFSRTSDSSGLVVATCPSLDIKSQGTNPEQARAALQDSIELFLRHCWKRGIFEEVLRRRGFEPCADGDGDGACDVIHISERPDAFESWTGDFEVPFHLVAEAQRLRQGVACPQA